MGSMDNIFSPKTIAVVGASETPGSVGRAIMDNLLTQKNASVFPVNPKRKKIVGLDACARVADVAEHIDLAVIATPARTVPDLVEECGEAGVGGIIIVSAGFKEIGERGKELEDRIRRIRKRYGMRIVGPNCLGVIRPVTGLNASFLNVRPDAGQIAFISQSGALGSAILDWAMHAHIGFSLFASLGSMMDVDFGDLIDFLGDDPNTKSIMLYMEGIGNAKKFISAAKGFARNKPIIVLKPGRFAESARAALSHTGSMGGEDHTYDAAFKRVGVVRVRDIADLFNVAEVLHARHLPKGPEIAIVTNAGGAGVIATDTLMALGGRLAQLTDDSMKALNEHLPAYWSKANPVDILGDADIGRYEKAVTACLDDPDVNGVITIYTPQGAAQPEDLAARFTAIAGHSYKPFITVWMGGERVEGARTMTLQHNIPTYDTPEEAVKTYLYMYRYGRNLELLYETPGPLPVDQAPPKHNLKAFIAELYKENRTLLTEKESKRFLINYGIPTVKPYLTKNLEEALGVANSVGYPVVLKIVSPDIVHKSDIGGVVTGIDSDRELKSEYGSLIKRVQKKAPQAAISGISVQQMVEKVDYELILGMRKDKDFGSVILFGMGGIGVEMFQDFSIGLPPLNQTLARRLMEETKVFRMIQGYRGRPPADMTQLEQILVSFSNLVVDFPEIAEIDINPLAVSGGKICALDARIVLDQPAIGYTGTYPHLVITPYPARYVIPWRLTDGTEVLLRPIRPEDEPLEHEMLSTLSEEALRGRFFQVIKKITHEMLIRFCNIDYDREMAIVAELREEETKRIIGIGRLIIEPDGNSSEFAVVVHDDFQGKGLGYKLVDMLIGVAQDKRVGEVTGSVLTDNTSMLRVCETLGFTTTHQPDGVSKVRLALK